MRPCHAFVIKLSAIGHWPCLIRAHNAAGAVDCNKGQTDMKLNRKYALLFAAASLSAITAPAFAQNASEQSGEIEFLKAQVEAMQAQIIDLQKAPAPKNTPSFKGAAHFADKDAGWDFKVRGRIQYDFGYVSNPSNAINTKELGFSSELRRGRLGVEGKMPGSFSYKLEADLAGNEVSLADALIQWKGNNFTATVGQHKTFSSLEEMTSSRFTAFLERAAFTDAFGFERRVGVSGGFNQGDFSVDAGVFTDDISALNGSNNSYSLDARAVYAPKIGNNQLHFGGSIHHRELQDIAGNVRYRQRPQIHTTGMRFVATPNLPTESETSYGLEAAGIFGPIHVAGEAHWLKQGLMAAGAKDPGYFGGYAEVGYFFTGETLGYKGGAFNRTKVNNPINKGGMGALQGVVRVDHLNLNDRDAGVIGGKQTAYQLGLTWIPMDYVRFLLNYSRVELKDAAVLAGTKSDYGVDVIGVRAQLDF